MSSNTKKGKKWLWRSAAGGGAELRGSGGAQRALRRYDERGGGEIVEDCQGRGDEC